MDYLPYHPHHPTHFQDFFLKDSITVDPMQTIKHNYVHRPATSRPASSFASPTMSRNVKGKGVDRNSRREPSEDEDSDEGSDNDDWRNIEDPGERRKIQNRLAQRKFREKSKVAREESIRASQNQASARNAYARPDPRDLEHGNASSGLPWGGISVRHVVERGGAREASDYAEAARRSRESSYYEPRGGRGEASSTYYGGGRDARGTPAPTYLSSERGGRGGRDDSSSYYSGGREARGGSDRGARPGDRDYYPPADYRGRGTGRPSVSGHDVGLQLSSRFAAGRPPFDFPWIWGSRGVGPGGRGYW